MMMSQIIAAVGSEYAVTAFFVAAVAAIVVPWYAFRPSRDFSSWRQTAGTVTSSEAITRQTSSSTLTRSNSAGDTQRTLNSSGDSPSYPSTSDHEGTSVLDKMSFTVRVKYHESDRQFNVTNATTVEHLKRLAFPTEFSQGKRIRLIFCGRILHEDNHTLEQYNIGANSILHCQISDVQQQSNENRQAYTDQGPDLDLGHVLIPTIAIGLLMVWFCVFTYSELFTSTSVTVLGAMTILFGMFVFLT